MPAEGINRYVRLWQHIANPAEYIMHKSDRRHRSLSFTTKPLPLHFQVTEPLYQVFKELFMQDVYEIDALVAQLPEQPVVIDIGANAGFFAVQLLSKIKRATVYAYEPVPANVQAFQQTLEANPRLKRTVHLFQMAVTGHHKAVIDLFAEAADDNQVVASVLASFHENNTRTLTVKGITLTSIIESNNLAVIDLLKMDCEGSEYDIFYNTDPDLFRRVRHIVMEVHDLDADRNNVSALTTYLESLGFQTKHVPINSFCHSLEGIAAGR
ncbi:FkbM family methyltransferase [Fibrella forsythiae]|uniref:FkbM family methyltransferase n=1 Tax=Fibrella forsythiae TaxID=2817061 RepID=A0ABS3JPV1_9BACT|nr:FkbM family methyltransferase [Fibrella forsythiae]MBO0952025.1 FkbM family methyltransferase [Fibrella forsythiae]